jgi:hypothetical protein
VLVVLPDYPPPLDEVDHELLGNVLGPENGQPKPMPGSKDSFSVTHRLRIEKAFAFQKTDTGGWRCNTTSLQPVDFGVAQSGP